MQNLHRSKNLYPETKACPFVQERLLLSLLPAHIARVMKAEIIQRLQGPNFGRTESTNNFHNLYVQRHTNVR